MRADFEARYHVLEEQHWWFKARRDMVLSFIRQAGLSKDAAILEVGCSGGPLMLTLAGEGYTGVHGIDISEAAIELARSRGVKNVQVMDAGHLRFDDRQFDLLIASDVLEHIEDDRAALASWRRVLKPGGRLIVFVPAFNALWSDHDEVNQHFRRYTRRTLRQALVESGFSISRAGYWNVLLFAPVCAARLLMRLRPSRRQKPQSHQLSAANPIVNRMLLSILRLENRVTSGGVTFPIGVSTFALASTPPD